MFPSVAGFFNQKPCEDYYYDDNKLVKAEYTEDGLMYVIKENGEEIERGEIQSCTVNKELLARIAQAQWG